MFPECTATYTASYPRNLKSRNATWPTARVERSSLQLLFWTPRLQPLCPVPLSHTASCKQVTQTGRCAAEMCNISPPPTTARRLSHVKDCLLEKSIFKSWSRNSTEIYKTRIFINVHTKANHQDLYWASLIQSQTGGSASDRLVKCRCIGPLDILHCYNNCKG